ncbi:MAG: DUF4173 domain-containing protein [Ruminococcaceae bacterium]|nr:DUF4173 domain-containing protein [Oscillospiraceae bacterium]
MDNIQNSAGITPLPYAPSNKRELTLTKRDCIFAAFFLAASVLLVFAGFFERFASGFAVSLFILTLVYGLYMLKDGKKTVLSIGTLLISLVIPFVFLIHFDDNARLTAAAVCLASAAVFSVAVRSGDIDTFKDIKDLFYANTITVFSNLAPSFKGLTKVGKDRKTALQILLAVLLSIPVIVIIISLLVSYDTAFSALMKSVAETLGRTLFEIIISITVFVFIFSYATGNRYGMYENESSDGEIKRFIKKPFSFTFLILISLVYLIYLVSQFAYIFNSFGGLLPDSFSFAEYARRGFFEAEAILMINYAVSLGVMLFGERKENAKHFALNKALVTFLNLFSLFIVSTAFFKMKMYVASYGLTVKRFVTFVIMAASVLFVLALIIRLYRYGARVFKYAFILSLLIFTAVSFAGIDRTVARYNTDAYLNGKLQSVDVKYIASLSRESALPELIKLSECQDAGIRNEAEAGVKFFYNTYEDYSSRHKIELKKDSEGKDIITMPKPAVTELSLSTLRCIKALDGAHIEFSEADGEILWGYLYDDGFTDGSEGEYYPE